MIPCRRTTRAREIESTSGTRSKESVGSTYPESDMNQVERKRALELKAELEKKKHNREEIEKDVYRFRNDLIKYQNSRKHMEERKKKLILKEKEVDEEIAVLKAQLEKRRKLIEDFVQQRDNLQARINQLAPQE